MTEINTFLRALYHRIDEAKKEMNNHYDDNPYDGGCCDLEGMRLEAELTGLQQAEKMYLECIK